MGLVAMSSCVPPNLAASIAAYDADPTYFEKRYSEVDTDRLLSRFVGSLRGGPGIVIDAGCGTGRDLGLLNAAGVRSVGVDLSSGLLGVASGAGAGPVVRADLRRMPFAGESARGVWSMASLVHLDRQHVLEATREFSRVLASEAPLCLSTMEGTQAWWTERCRQRRWFRPMTADEVAAVIEKGGLRIVDLEVASGSIGGRWVNVIAQKP